MSLTNRDLLHFDRRIERLEKQLSVLEKGYAERVCEAVFDGLLPNASWCSSDSLVQFKRKIEVEHLVINGVTTPLQSYIKVITCKKFIERFAIQIPFKFDIEYLKTEDDIATEDISPLYWGDAFIDEYKLTIELGQL